MKPIGGDIEQIRVNIERLRKLQAETKNTQRKVITCLGCGTKMYFSSKQYLLKCNCGSWIRRGDYVSVASDNSCNWCDDKGYLFYKTQIEDRYIEKSARCVCPAGKKISDKVLPCITKVKDAPNEFVNRVIFNDVKGA